MTFLEFTCRKLIGKPIGSHWMCPWCSEPTLDVLPRKDGCKDRVKCRNPECDEWGDALDILRAFHPSLSFDERLKLSKVYREEFEDTGGHDPSLQETVDRGNRLIRAAYSKWIGSVDPDDRETERKAALRALVFARQIADEDGVLLRDLAVHAAKQLRKLKRRQTKTRRHR